MLIPQRADRVAAERDKNTLTNCCADEHAQFLALRDYFARRDDLVFDGLAGDVLSQSQRLDPALHASFADGRFDDVAERVLGDAASMEPALQGLLTSAAMARLPRTAAAARVRAQAATHAGAPNPIASFYFFSRMRREIALAPYALLDVAAVSTPFLDAAIVDLLLSVPFEIVRARRLHTDALQPAVREHPVRGQGTGARRACARAPRRHRAGRAPRRAPRIARPPRRCARAHRARLRHRTERAPLVPAAAGAPDGRGGARGRHHPACAAAVRRGQADARILRYSARVRRGAICSASDASRTFNVRSRPASR